jgi:hypothetical protein
MRLRWTTLLVCAGLCACHRTPADLSEASTSTPPSSPASPSGSPSSSAPSSTSVVAPWPSTSAPLPAELPAGEPPSAGEARRSTVPALERDPRLRPFLSILRAHFLEGGPAGPFALQWIDRAGGGAAVLVARADESDPVVLAVDRDHVLYAREHPAGGITPPVLHITLAPGPERGVAFFAFVPAMHLVAARMWADDGNPYAEIVTLSTDACDALSAAYAAGMGWIVACSSKTGTRAQRLREDLTVGWGTEGVVVGTIGPVDRPVITFDGADAGAPPRTWTLTQRAKAVGGDRTLTFRYDADGQPVAQPMPSSSTSKTRVELGGMTGGKPRAP